MRSDFLAAHLPFLNFRKAGLPSRRALRGSMLNLREAWASVEPNLISVVTCPIVAQIS